MIKSYKVRLYPTKEQEQKMWQHIGSCRYIWNYMLDLQQKKYSDGEKHMSHFDMVNILSPLKKESEHIWLNEVSNYSLGLICGDLHKAYTSFFRKQSGLPKFKSRKRAKANYPVRQSLWFDEKSHAHIEKIGKVKFKTDFGLPVGKGCKFTNPRISNVNGKWMLSFGMECENQAHILTDNPMGIDIGVKDTMVVAYGNEKLVFPNINKGNKIRSLKKRMTHLQRSISRKYEANKQGNKYIKTKNIERKEYQLRNLYARLANIRSNYIHQSTRKLVSLLPYRVVMEDLNVRGMMKNRHLSKSIQEQCFYEIIRQMKYKCEWKGIPFVQADGFFPSSKLCSNCGCVNSNLKLSDRIYVCPECGFTIDRDYQAALNLSRYEA